MDIYVDVVIHSNANCCDECKFLFNIFSHNHDVYFCSNRIVAKDRLIFRDGDPDVVFTVNLELPLRGVMGWLHMVEYVRDTIRHALDTGQLPEKFRKCLDEAR